MILINLSTSNTPAQIGPLVLWQRLLMGEILDPPKIQKSGKTTMKNP